LSALCLSGGGIRSASISLGVIQALADKALLREFDYLSTVSGGGYIGSWLSAWLHRTQNADDVIVGLRQERSDSDHEAPPLSHLRRYSN
jgi:predicted acylesterase/phospholipase RssA